MASTLSKTLELIETTPLSDKDCGGGTINANSINTKLINMDHSTKITEGCIGRFVGQPYDMGWGRLYGGHLLAQACDSAWKTVEGNKLLHSLQGYFLRVGSVRFPIEYVVYNLREGKSISHRRVEVFQNGHLLFHLTASFAPSLIPKGLSHQIVQPASLPPDMCRTEQEMMLEYWNQLSEEEQKKAPKTLYRRIFEPQPFDIRPIYPENFLAPNKNTPLREMWIRTNQDVITSPKENGIEQEKVEQEKNNNTFVLDSMQKHILLALYASDFPLLGTALQQHGRSVLTSKIRIASLDHNFWIHRPFQIDDWLLFRIESPISANGRALVQGSFFTKDGQQVATCVQEGWIKI